MPSFRVNTDKVAWRVVDGEVVLLHADSSAYFGLNATATYIWQAISTAPLTPEEISGRVGAEYGLGCEAVRHDVDTFLDSLGEQSLVVELPAADRPLGEAPGSGHGGRRESEYAPPQLVRFGELEQLVLSGE
jgi:Coenzyme PQQ synthesis protein D (PqqD)